MHPLGFNGLRADALFFPHSTESTQSKGDVVRMKPFSVGDQHGENDCRQNMCLKECTCFLHISRNVTVCLFVPCQILLSVLRPFFGAPKVSKRRL